MKGDMDHDFFMREALKEAEKALLSNEFPVGCVVVSEGSIIATGSRTGTKGLVANELDHAEIVALRNLETSDRHPSGMTLYTTMEPCLMCLGAIVIHGIGQIVYAYEDAMGGGTSCTLAELPALYRNSKISIISDVLRKESLALFKAFFSNPDNRYWQNSLLAEYTLAQK